MPSGRSPRRRTPSWTGCWVEPGRGGPSVASIPGGPIDPAPIARTRCYDRRPVSEVVSVVFEREDIRRRIEELGRTITGDYEGRAPVLISVLKGGSVFLADLIRAIALPVAIDYMSISRYGGAAESRGPRAHREGPRPGHRGPRRDRRRGHRRHRAHALVPRVRPRVARAGVDRGVRAARQERATDRPARDRVPGLRVSRRVRRRRTVSTSRSATATCPTSSRSTTSRRSARIPTCCCRTSRAGTAPRRRDSASGSGCANR